MHACGVIYDEAEWLQLVNFSFGELAQAWVEGATFAALVDAFFRR